MAAAASGMRTPRGGPRGGRRRRCRSGRRRAARAAPGAGARAPRSAALERAAARSVWRASAVTEAASGPLPQTSPIRAATGAARAEEVVEVAADLDPLAGGEEAHGRGEARGRWGGSAGAAALQDLGDTALARVEPALTIATEASWPSWARIASSRGVNVWPARVGDLELPSGRRRCAASRRSARPSGPASVRRRRRGGDEGARRTGRPRGGGRRAAARRARSRAASTVSWRTSSTVSDALIRSEASVSARSCMACSCSSRATSWTSW